MIDDDESILKLYTLYLETEGYNVVSKTDALAAKDWLLSNMPDLILMDIMLPDVTGIEFCKWITSQPRFQDVPIIHMTAYMDDEVSREDSMLAGAKELISKSDEADDLIKAVKKFM